MKAIAILSRSRSPSLPDLPSAHEQGLAGFDVNSWYGFFVPKRTPAPIVQKLHAATLATMETPSVRARLQEVGAEIVAPERRTSAYFETFVRQEAVRWTAATKAANLEHGLSCSRRTPRYAERAADRTPPFIWGQCSLCAAHGFDSAIVTTG